MKSTILWNVMPYNLVFDVSEERTDSIFRVKKQAKQTTRKKQADQIVHKKNSSDVGLSKSPCLKIWPFPGTTPRGPAFDSRRF
jgi:hypothetical protein